jgi:hypothetical protein
VDGRRCIKSNTINLLIRIDTSDEDILLSDNHSFCLSIFLYNFGVVASSMASHKSRSKSRGFTIDLLAYALQLLENLFEETKEHPYHLKRVVFVTVAVLGALTPLLQDCKRELGNVTNHLEYLHEVAASLDDSGLFHDCMERAAAAA